MNTQNMQSTISVHHQHNEAPHTIFRPAAGRRSTQQQAPFVLPRRVAMRTIVVVWIVFGLLLAATGGIWLARMPIYLFGAAIIIDQGSTIQRKPVLVAFLPPSARPQLAPGQSLLVQLGADGTYRSQTITVVDSEIVSPDVAQRRYASGSRPLILQPAAVAIAPLALTEDVTAGRTTDAHYPVKVVVGTRRLISFLPFFHRMLPE